MRHWRYIALHARTAANIIFLGLSLLAALMHLARVASIHQALLWAA